MMKTISVFSLRRIFRHAKGGEGDVGRCRNFSFDAWDLGLAGSATEGNTGVLLHVDR
jgi:hypothetical protein